MTNNDSYSFLVGLLIANHLATIPYDLINIFLNFEQHFSDEEGIEAFFLFECLNQGHQIMRRVTSEVDYKEIDEATEFTDLDHMLEDSCMPV
ncbi:hypothetical protein MMC10_011036 [Thelotrema lepadinum]|nr:hypothetical protein [Thelotrema lepadinum]